MLNWYDKVKRFVHRTIHSRPDVSPTPLATFFDATVMVLTFASVINVFVVTFDLTPVIMDILKTAETAIVAAFMVEYMLCAWNTDLLLLRRSEMKK